MTELHGWLAVRDTPADEDRLPPDETERIMNGVREIAAETDCVKLTPANGELYLSTLFCSNHRTPEVDEIIGAYRKIAELASGSYGMILLRDDEDSAHSNEFVTYIFKRGICSVRTDSDFSPCIPTIEDGVS